MCHQLLQIPPAVSLSLIAACHPFVCMCVCLCVCVCPCERLSRDESEFRHRCRRRPLTCSAVCMTLKVRTVELATWQGQADNMQSSAACLPAALTFDKVWPLEQEARDPIFGLRSAAFLERKTLRAPPQEHSALAVGWDH